jgi:hypothetical protein
MEILDQQPELMRTVSPTRYHEGKPVIEIESYNGQGFFVELARGKDSRLVLFLYQGCGANHGEYMLVPNGNSLFCPPDEDEFTRHVRFARKLENYESERDLLQRVDEFIGRCLDLDDRH